MRRILIATLVLVGLITCPAVLPQDHDPNYEVSFSETAGPMGSEQTVICLFDNPNAGDDINGWSLAVCHDASLVQVVSAVNGETTNTVNNGNPPELGFITILPGEGVIMGMVIVIIGGPGTPVLPPGSGYELLEVTYLLNGEEGEVAELTYDCALDDPPVNTIFVINGGQTLFPTLIPGEIEILPVHIPIPEFVRGDCNTDGQYSIADAIFLFSALFVPGAPPTPCEVSCDANDDGLKNIADAINILSNLFTGGPNPPPPFLGCGFDPTVDTLGCGSFDVCP